MLGGALVIGVLSAVLTEWVQTTGRVEASTALGVCSRASSLWAAPGADRRDKVDIDPDCVLYGTIETNRVGHGRLVGSAACACVNGAVLVFNLLLIAVFYKELLISAFDPSLARAMGIHAGLINYGVMAVTAATLVAAFESVGASWCWPCSSCRRRGTTADRSAAQVAGRQYAVRRPQRRWPGTRWRSRSAPRLQSLGISDRPDASTAGMMAVAAGLFCWSPRCSPRAMAW